MSSRKLSDLQRRRISRRREDIAKTPPADTRMEQGQVVARLRRHAEVRPAGSDETVLCDIRASLTTEIVCGDHVQWWRQEDGRGVIEQRDARRSELRRPGPRGGVRVVAANLDQLIIVSAVLPAPDTRLVDQYLVCAESSGIEPLLVLNKSDLPGFDAARQQLAPYLSLGYRLLSCSAGSGADLDLLRQQSATTTCALVGQSGVGKSSLIRRLSPGADPAIGALSHASETGRHTTTTARMYRFADDGWLIDAPGIREFPLMPMPREQLQRCFPEFRPLLGQCRFHNCRHDGEPGCAIQAALDTSAILPWRLAHFHEFAAGMEGNARR